MNGSDEGNGRFIVMLDDGMDLETWMKGFHHPGVQESLAIPLIGGFRCRCDHEGHLALQAHPRVARVEPDIPISLTGRSIWQRHRKRAVEVIPEGVQAIHAPAAWSMALGDGVKVAIIDTGIDLAHPDLAANIAGGINLVEAGAPPQDDVGHGTHVAGTVAAAQNAAGIVGVAPRALLYSLKVLGLRVTGLLSDIILALQWVVDQRIQIVNISLGTPTYVQALERAVTNALNAGVVIVAGAGNGGPEAVEYPAAIPGVLTVGAVTASGQIGPFSSTGPHIDLVAPGVGILSTIPGNRYGVSSGTSMASPHAAGVAALYLQLHPTATPEGVRVALTESAVPLGGLSRLQQGHGLVNARRAVESARGPRT